MYKHIVKPGIPEQYRWFNEARFGMFIHFGLYALLGRGEWVMYDENIPRQRYEKLARRFNPRKFDADAWVALAREAGAKYITVTAKHHDGFCLFDSDLTDFKITNTPFGRDLIGELAVACRRAGMRIVLYYSQPDWHHPHYVHQRGAFKDLDHPPAGDRPDLPRFQAYLEGQLRELCTRYGRIDGIWFDGSHKSEEHWRGRRLYRLIKRYQPHAVINDRARYGDFFTPERKLPDDLTGYLFEACQSVLTKAWGYRPDSPLYSVPYLVRSLARMAVGGGNFLLNVGPDAQGVIPEDQAARMRAVGQWLQCCGSAVYGTAAGPDVTVGLCATKKSRRDGVLPSTVRGESLYLYLLDWPETNRLDIEGLGPIRSARLLNNGARLKVRKKGPAAWITGLPSTPPDPGVNIIKVNMARAVPPRTKARPDPRPEVLPAGDDREITLDADSAALTGRGIKGKRLQRSALPDGTSFIGNWSAPQQTACWALNCSGRKVFDVKVTLVSPPGHQGAILALAAGSEELTAVVPLTSDAQRPVTISLGRMTLGRGSTLLKLYPRELQWGHIFPGIVGLVLRRVAPARQKRG